MTDEQKAEDLAARLLYEDQNKQPLIDLLLEMANWKDEQFKFQKL